MSKSEKPEAAHGIAHRIAAILQEGMKEIYSEVPGWGFLVETEGSVARVTFTKSGKAIRGIAPWAVAVRMDDAPPLLEDGMSAVIAVSDDGTASAVAFKRRTEMAERIDDESLDEAIGWVEEHVAWEVLNCLEPILPDEFAPPVVVDGDDPVPLPPLPAEGLLGTIQVEWTSQWVSSPLVKFSSPEACVPE